MDRTEFFRRQAESFAKHAQECTEPETKLRPIAEGYEEMLGRQATVLAKTISSTPTLPVMPSVT